MQIEISMPLLTYFSIIGKSNSIIFYFLIINFILLIFVSIFAEPVYHTELNPTETFWNG